MKTIPLTQGKEALVDDHWYEHLMQWKWCASKVYKTPAWYAVRGVYLSDQKEQQQVRMHVVIAGAKDDQIVDHRNGDSLDNREKNLRVCTVAQNQRNRGKNRNNTSGYKGVYWSTKSRKWCAKIQVNRRQIYLGSFSNIIDAALAYDAAAIRYHGSFAKANFPELSAA